MRRLLLALILAALVWAWPVQATDVVLEQVLYNPGGRVDYDPVNDWVYFDRRDPEHDCGANGGCYRIYRAKPDGSSLTDLTSDVAADVHIGNPAVSDDGTLVVFQVERDGCTPFPILAEPGKGTCNDIYVMDADGDNKTLIDTTTGGALHPQWAAAGDKIAYAERIADDDWALTVCTFNGTACTAILTSQPCALDMLYETHAWLSSDTFLFSAICDVGDSDYNDLDIWRFTVSTEAILRITPNDQNWDEHAHPTPDGKWIMWASGKDNATLGMLDYWLMAASTANPTRLTNYNNPSHGAYVGAEGVATGDFAWLSGTSPTNLKFVAYVVHEITGGTTGRTSRFGFVPIGGI